MGNAQFQVATPSNTFPIPTDRWFRVEIPWFGIEWRGVLQRLRDGLTLAGGVETTDVAVNEEGVLCTFQWTRPPAPVGAPPSLTPAGAAQAQIQVRCFSVRGGRLCGPRQFLINVGKISRSNIAPGELDVLMRRIGACFDNATEVQLTNIGTYI